MNLLSPSVPSGPHGVPGAGEGAQARRDIADGDFAAALAETAGETGDDVGGDEPRMQKPDAPANLLRATRLVDVRAAQDARAPQHGETPTPGTGIPPEIASEPKAKGVRRAEKAAAPKVEPGEVMREVPATVTAPEPIAAAAAVREVLAVLGAELTARPERTAAPELVVSVRKAATVRGGNDVAGSLKDAAEMPDLGPDLGPNLGDESEVEIVPVRVVRQEKHFQPAGVEARRWQIAQDSFEGARAMPMQMPAPEAAKAEAVQRERPAIPTALARAPEAATPVVAPVPSMGDLVPGTVGIQIADRVQQALSAPSEPAASSPPAGASPEIDTRQSFAPALRTIKLQLNPADLGAVTIVLSGNDEGLRIELSAELADTVSKVENDRNVLAARLSGAGYAVTDISVARFAGAGPESDARDSGARHGGGAQEQPAGHGARDGGTQFADQHAGRRFGTPQAHGGMGGVPSQGAAAAPVVSGVSYAARFRPI